jgi:hypothetical protein
LYRDASVWQGIHPTVHLIPGRRSPTTLTAHRSPYTVTPHNPAHTNPSRSQTLPAPHTDVPTRNIPLLPTLTEQCLPDSTTPASTVVTSRPVTVV